MAMLVLLNVIPDKLVQQPLGVALSKIRIGTGYFMRKREAVAALRTHNERAVGDPTVFTQPFGRYFWRVPQSACQNGTAAKDQR